MYLSPPLTHFCDPSANRVIEVKELSLASPPCITIFFHTGEALHCIAEIVQRLHPQGEMKGRKERIVLICTICIIICTRATPSSSTHDVLNGVYLRRHEWKVLCHPSRVSGTLPELISSFPAAHFSAFPSAPHPEQWLWCKAAAQKLLGGCQATVLLLVIDKPSLLPLLSPSPLKKRGFIFQGFARGKYLIGLSLGKWNKESDL